MLYQCGLVTHHTIIRCLPFLLILLQPFQSSFANSRASPWSNWYFPQEEAPSPAEFREPGISFVTNTNELYEAVANGTTHIQLQRHMYLMEHLIIQPTTKSFRVRYPSTIHVTIALHIVVELPLFCYAPGRSNSCRVRKSAATVTDVMQGNCAKQDKVKEGFVHPTGTSPLRSPTEKQCVLVMANSHVVIEDNLWIESLYFRMVRGEEYFHHEALITTSHGLEVWMHNILIQGSGSDDDNCWECGIELDSGAQVHLEGCLFADIAGETIVSATEYSNVTFNGCSFRNISLRHDIFGPGAVLEAYGSHSDTSRMKLQDAHFIGIPEMQWMRQSVYSMDEIVQFDVDGFFTESERNVVRWHRHIPGPDVKFMSPTKSANLDDVLSPSDGSDRTWLWEVQKEALSFGGTALSSNPMLLQNHLYTPTPPPSQSPSEIAGPGRSSRGKSSVLFDSYAPEKSTSSRSDVISALCTAAAVLGACGLAAFGFLWRQKHIVKQEKLSVRRALEPKSEVAIEIQPDSEPDSEPEPEPESQDDSEQEEVYLTVSLSQGLMDGSMYISGAGQNTFDNSSVAESAPVWHHRRQAPTPPQDKQVTSLLAFIHQQLDCYCVRTLFNRRYWLLGPDERKQGGQAVVQFAVARDQQGKVMVAIKFFATQEEFEVEETLYLRTPEVRHCMPCVVQSVNNKSGTVCDPFGNELPPHIVLERGVCLATVAASRRELGTTMIGKMLYDVAVRVWALHRSGWAHRDLKPGNIMFLQKRMRWVLIDFGIAGMIGAPASVRGTALYAAPEVAEASQNKQETMDATAALDAWSLGIIALELVLGYHPLGALSSQDEIFNRLVDTDRPFPWDEGTITEDQKEKLGEYLNPIRKLLQRDPTARPTLHQFQQELYALLKPEQQPAT